MFKAISKKGESKWFKTQKASINFCKKRKGGFVEVYSPFQSKATSTFEV